MKLDCLDAFMTTGIFESLLNSFQISAPAAPSISAIFFFWFVFIGKQVLTLLYVSY